MIDVNAGRVYLAPQNMPSAIVLTLGNKVVLYCSVKWRQIWSIRTNRRLKKNTGVQIFSGETFLKQIGK